MSLARAWEARQGCRQEGSQLNAGSPALTAPPRLPCSMHRRSKNALLFAAYALLIAFAVATAIGVALNCPSLASPSLALLLLMLLLTWGAVWGTTTGLKVGADG